MLLKKPVSFRYWLLLLFTASLSSWAVPLILLLWTFVWAILLLWAVLRIVIVWAILSRAFAGTFVATVGTILVVWTLLVAVCLSWTFFSWAVVIVRALVCCIYG